MSLGVVIKGTEGVVLAADSRVTIAVQKQGEQPFPINFDNVTKLLSFQSPHSHVAVVTYGAAVLGLRTAHSFIPEFDVELGEKSKRMTIKDYADKLSDFFMQRCRDADMTDSESPPMTFIVGGYDPSSPYGSVFLFHIPHDPTPIEQNPGEESFGMTWGGQLQLASRIIQGFDPILPQLLVEELNLTQQQIQDLLKKFNENLEFKIPYQVLPLQDCVNLAKFMIQTTMTAQDLAIGVRGVGGPIDLAVVTRTDGLVHLSRKELHV